jgi:8-oxo-dGTP pyrophosphatase MutT (NUDIX family)
MNNIELPKRIEYDPNLTPNVRAVNVLIINNKEELLLVKRGGDHTYFPGYYGVVLGKLEEGEEMEEGFKREVWEETGIEVSNEISIDCPKPFFTQWKGKIYENRYFFLFVNKGTEVDLKGENEEYLWVDKEKLPELDLPNYANCFKYGLRV